METLYEDDDFDKLLEELDEFGKDALIKHVLTELELMRAMLELMRAEIRQMNSGGGVNPWSPSTPWSTPRQINGSGIVYTVNTANTGDVQIDSAAIDSLLDDDVAGF